MYLKQNFYLCRPIVKFALLKHSATSISNIQCSSTILDIISKTSK